MLADDDKLKVLRRLRRIGGQLQGVQSMIDEERYCIDVLTQISAARAALAQVSKVMLKSHIDTCVTTAFRNNDEKARQQKIDELVRVFEKNCNC